MKAKVCITMGACIPLWFPFLAAAQGEFRPYNSTAPTRLESLDGPLAGDMILGQFLVGADPLSLAPIGQVMPHLDGFGIVQPTSSTMSVPGIPCATFAYIQLAAWNGDLWGNSLGAVPVHQIGLTDVARHVLGGCGTDPVGEPRFTQPAIVPPIPEPSAFAILFVGAMVTLVLRSARRWLHA